MQDRLQTARREPLLLVCVGVLLFQYAMVGLTTDFAETGSSTFGDIARNLSESAFYSVDGATWSYWRPPLYPILLSGVITIGSEYWEALARIVQAVFGLGSLFLVHRLSLAVFRERRVASIAVCLYAANFALHKEQLAQRDTVVIEFLTLLFAMMTLRCADSRRHALIAALAAGLAFLSRPTGLFLLPALVLVLALSELSAKRRILRIAICVAVFELVLLPWQVYHVAAFGSFSPGTPTNGGVNLFKGNSELVASIYPALDPDDADAFIVPLTAGLDEHSGDAFLRARALEAIEVRPGAFLRRVLEKTFYFFTPLEVPFGKGAVVPDGEGGLAVNDFRVDQGLKALLLFPLAFVVLPLGCLGFIESIRRRGNPRRFGLLTIAIVAGYVLIYALTFAQLRFRMPLAGLFCISAGFVLARIFAPRDAAAGSVE